MEAIGLAASIMAIAETSLKIIVYLSDVKNGPKCRLLLLREVRETWWIYSRFEEDIDLTRGELAEESWVKPLKALDGPDGIASQVSKQLAELKSKLSVPEGRVEKAISNIKWPFQEKEANTIVERLHGLKETTLIIIQQSNFRLAQDLRHDMIHVSSHLDHTKFVNLLAWLTPLNFKQKQEEILGCADPYSCSLLASHDFRLWQDGQLRSLWCFGAPGVGKSVAAASIYAHLVRRYKEENVAVVIAFCSCDDEQSRSPRNIVSGLLKQILQRRGSHNVPSKLAEEYTRAITTEDGQPLSLSAVTELLEGELHAFDGAYVILDGLDEVRENDRASMVEALHGIRAGTRVIVTSRYLEDISEAFKRTQVCKSCRKEDTEAKAYWRSRDCASHVVCDGCHSASILTDTNKHQTLIELKFLLARRHVDFLSECLTAGDLERTLECLPNSLNEMYTESLKRMDRGLTSDRHQLLLKKLLTWIAWGQRPLTVAELGHALFVHKDIKDIRNRDILPVRDITSWSAGLLFVDRDDLVRVIHPTLSRFFVERRDALYPGGDNLIAHACLDYLAMAPLKEPLSGANQRHEVIARCEKYPLIRYAVEHSFKHVARSEEKDDDRRAMSFLLSDSRKSFVQALYHLDKKWSINEDVSALHIAVHHGLVHIVKSLIEEGENVDSQEMYGATPLMYAANRGDEAFQELRVLLKAGADASTLCSGGSTALMRAVALGAERCVTWLLRAPGVNINAAPSNDSFLPVLAGAIRASNDTIVKKLLAHKDVDVNFTRQGTLRALAPLHHAVMLENVSALKLLLGHKDINVDIQEPGQWWTPLFYSTTGEVAGLLLDHGADIDFQDKFNGTALMRAVDRRAHEVAELLIKRGADVNCRDMLGRTVLHSAAKNSSRLAMEYMVKNVFSIDINAQGKQGETALHDSCERMDAWAVTVLVNAGARCDIRNNDGRTALDIAELRKSPKISEILKKASGFDGTGGMHIKKTLAEAVVADPVDVLQLRIANASIEDLHKSSAFVGTPLHEACRYGRADVVKMLLDAGCDTEIKNSFDRTPIYMAIHHDRLGCLKILINHGANMEASPYHDLSLWEYACSLGFGDVAMTMIEHGANINKASGYQHELLLQAVYVDHAVVARRLVEAGASIHQKVRGMTAIKVADDRKSLKVLEYFGGLGNFRYIVEKYMFRTRMLDEQLGMVCDDLSHHPESDHLYRTGHVDTPWFTFIKRYYAQRVLKQPDPNPVSPDGLFFLASAWFFQLKGGIDVFHGEASVLPVMTTVCQVGFWEHFCCLRKRPLVTFNYKVYVGSEINRDRRIVSKLALKNLLLNVALYLGNLDLIWRVWGMAPRYPGREHPDRRRFRDSYPYFEHLLVASGHGGLNAFKLFTYLDSGFYTKEHYASLFTELGIMNLVEHISKQGGDTRIIRFLLGLEKPWDPRRSWFHWPLKRALLNAHTPEVFERLAPFGGPQFTPLSLYHRNGQFLSGSTSIGIRLAHHAGQNNLAMIQYLVGRTSEYFLNRPEPATMDMPATISYYTRLTPNYKLANLLVKQQPLYKAVTTGSLELVDYMLQAGADCNISRTSSATALSVAVRRCDINMVRLLIEKGGADPNRGTPPPIVLAVQAEYTAMIHLLLEKGAIIDTPKTGGWAMTIAKECGLDTMKQLLVGLGVKAASADASPYANSQVDYAQESTRELMCPGFWFLLPR
ncbi:hypothetical protein PspLS_05724 [Pyricularia sp. CBS 133598]|nr:hypothetical protein PspLS_05724 [Pyricularia sp. CBS 133598]